MNFHDNNLQQIKRQNRDLQLPSRKHYNHFEHPDEFQDLNAAVENQQGKQYLRDNVPYVKAQKHGLERQFQNLEVAVNKKKSGQEDKEIQYSQYLKNTKRVDQTPFTRLKSKLNFILLTATAENEPLSVSYYSNSENSQSVHSLSSESIHSNKRYISYLDKSGENDKKKKKVGQDKVEQQSEHQILKKEGKQNQKNAKTFLFYQPEKKIQNIKEANRIQRLNIKLQVEKQLQGKDFDVNISQKHEKNDVQNKNEKKQIKVIFAEEPIDPQLEDISNAEKIKVENREDKLENRGVKVEKQQKINILASQIRINFNSKLKDKSQKRDKSMIRSMDKSRDSKLTPKNNKRRNSFEDLENILAQIQQKQGQEHNQIMRSISIHSRNKDVVSSFQDIGANSKNSENNRYTSKQQNVSNPDDFKEQSPKKADLLVQTFHGSDKNNEQQFQNLNGHGNIPKTDTRHELKEITPRQKVQNSHLKQINLQTSNDQETIKQIIPEKKVNFKLESKRKLKTQVAQIKNDNKKLAAIMKKRQQALAKKIKEQLHVKPQHLFYHDSSQVSKQSSFHQLEKIDLLSATKVVRHHSQRSNADDLKTIQPKYMSKRTSKQVNEQLLPTIDYSMNLRTINYDKRSTKSGKQLKRFRQSALLRNKLKSQKLSSNHEKEISFNTDSVRINKQISLLQSNKNKIPYSNLYKSGKGPIHKIKNDNPKEKYQKLKQLLGQM